MPQWPLQKPLLDSLPESGEAWRHAPFWISQTHLWVQHWLRAEHHSVHVRGKHHGRDSVGGHWKMKRLLCASQTVACHQGLRVLFLKGLDDTKVSGGDNDGSSQPCHDH